MKRLLGWMTLAALGLMLLACSVSARAADPMSGRWEINLAKSTYDPGPPPKSAVRVHELEGDTIKITLDIVSASGRVRHAEFSRKLDGKEYPDSDDPHADTISWKRIDERTLEFVQKTAGKTTETGRLQVSDDGTELTLSWKGQNEKDEAFNNLAVFDKR